MQHDFGEGLLLTFSLGGEKRKKAVDAVFEYIYFHLDDFYIYINDEDVRCDFLAWLYPSLETIMSRYNSSLSSFFTYLKMSLKFYFYSFKRHMYEKTSYDTVAENEQAYIADRKIDEEANTSEFNVYAASSPVEYSISAEKMAAIKNTTKWSSRKDEIYKRRILLLACKSCFFLNDVFISHIADALQVSINKLEAILDETKKRSNKRLAIYEAFVAKRDFYYIRYHSVKVQLQNIDELHTTRLQRLLRQKNYYYQLWQIFLQKTQSYNCVPSNRILAKQFGISRTTVDNNLADLRKACYASA